MDGQGCREDACGTHEKGSRCWGFKDLRRAHCWTCTFGHFMLIDLHFRPHYALFRAVDGAPGRSFCAGFDLCRPHYALRGGQIMLQCTHGQVTLCSTLGQVMPSRTHRPDLL